MDRTDVIIIVSLTVIALATTACYYGYNHNSGLNQRYSELQAQNVNLTHQLSTCKYDANVLNYSTCITNSEKNNYHCYNATYIDKVPSREFEIDWTLCPETQDCIAGFGARETEY